MNKRRRKKKLTQSLRRASKMEKIYRSFEGVQSPNGRTVKGTAVVFDSWSVDLGGFREIIKRGALTPEILNKSDIMANQDHNPQYVMARSKFGEGNLKLTLTERGLDFEFEAPETAKGEELLQHIKRGEYDSCSFCFTLPNEGGDRWYQDESGQLRREIIKFDRIWDISIVYTPAYEATTVDARSAEKVLLNERLDKYIDEINNLNLYEDE